MRDTVAAQACEILRREKLRIADFDGVAEFARQRGQERIQLLEKRAGVHEALPGKTAEFKNKRGDSWLIRRQEIQKLALKQLGVQE